MTTLNKINPNWCEYYKALAKCHLDNFDTIYVNEDGYPIDIGDVYNMMEEKR